MDVVIPDENATDDEMVNDDDDDDDDDDDVDYAGISRYQGHHITPSLRCGLDISTTLASG